MTAPDDGFTRLRSSYPPHMADASAFGPASTPHWRNPVMDTYDRPRRFWMVAGDGPTRMRHACLSSAEREAARLAQQCSGVTFFVMEAVAAHRHVTVERFDLRDDNIPF